MKMNLQFFKYTFGWGFLLWLFGYVLGILLFFMVPISMLGWIITPVATIVTLWVLVKQIKSVSLPHYLIIAVIWTILAIVLDYFFIVKTFKPEDGYYKPDVYLYYSLTFLLPIIVGWWKKNRTPG